MTSAAAFLMVLPVSRRAVSLRQPTGRDEMLLIEARGSEPARAIAFANRLAGDGLDAATLPAPDLDALLLRLRQALLGDRVLAETQCVAPSCRARAHIAFGIEAYLAHHAPREPRLRRCRVAPSPDAPGWFALARRREAGALPSADLRRRAGRRGSAGRCSDVGRALPRAYALSGASPTRDGSGHGGFGALARRPARGNLSGMREGMAVQFDPRRYVLAELRVRAGFVAAEVDALAARYHWTERAILNLPSARRAAYADMARRPA